MKTSIKSVSVMFFFIVCTLYPFTLQAQLKDKPISPVFNADGTVTLRLRAPEADSVSVRIQFLDTLKPMTKGKDGIWSATLGPIEPNIYPYSFLVNGVAMIDPQNPFIHTSLVPGSSLLFYPGEKPAFFDEQPVPHGLLHYRRYHSELLGDNRGYFVYTPPGYDSARQEKYPVLYLLHGYTDKEDGWTNTGRAQFILDNLIAEKKAVPMIIVMPFGYIPPQKAAGKTEGGTEPEDWGSWFKRVTPVFDQYILNDLIPRVEKEYRVYSDAGHRAIAGLSMGGGQTLYLGLKNPDTFGWICAFSSAVYDDFHGGLLNDPGKINTKVRLLWIGCGRDDFLYKNNMQFIDMLKAKNIRYVVNISEGQHTWDVWRNYLHEVMQQLFR